MRPAKPWYASKTLWFNLLALLVLMANQAGFSDYTPPPEVTTLAAAVGNLLLWLITRQGISFV